MIATQGLVSFRMAPEHTDLAENKLLTPADPEPLVKLPVLKPFATSAKARVMGPERAAVGAIAKSTTNPSKSTFIKSKAAKVTTASAATKFKTASQETKAKPAAGKNTL